MPIVTYDQYCEMIAAAREGAYAYPAVSVTNMINLTAAIEGLAAAGSDGIIQISPNAGANITGKVGDMVLGAIMMAEYARRLADRYEIRIALHTDHCPPGKVDSFLRPLIQETARRRQNNQPGLFNSHMYDASTLPLHENLANSVELMRLCTDQEIMLEIEIGIVGGEEDGISGEGVKKEKLYSSPDDMVAAYEALSPISPHFLLAATFGNVHGVYKPGHVVLRPGILQAGQAALAARHGADSRFNFVFHGGSGSSKAEIHETLDYGVVKMNIDTDTQYAFTRPVADHILRNYAGVMKIDGEVGSKKMYDPRAYLDKARAGMAERVIQVCQDLKSAGKSLGLSIV